MSWIMRSSTTATSEPLGLNGANRSLSMNRGLFTYGSAARTAWLKRSMCPIWTITPFSLRASSSSASASSSVVVIGFSMKTCLPRSIAALATAKCADVGTTTITASDASSKLSSDGCALTPSSVSTSCARSGRVSTNPLNWTPGRSRRILMWWNPRLPAPTTPTRGVFLKSRLRARSPRRICISSCTSGSGSSSVCARSIAWVTLRSDRKNSR